MDGKTVPVARMVAYELLFPRRSGSQLGLRSCSLVLATIAFFSTPVIGVTGLIMAFYAAIALVAWLTEGNWRAALLVFVFVPAVLGNIVLRLGLLR